MDIIDNASTLEDLHREAALSMHRLNRNLVSAEECSDCGDPLTNERREASPGCTMCVSCKEDEEKLNRRM